MEKKQPMWNDLIVAMATPPGIGAIGVIRLSGRGAIEIVNAIFPAKDLTIEPGNTLHVGMLSHHGKALDEVVLSLFKAPRSYTGEDVVEISCHGSPYIQQQIIETCIVMGARIAKPGEFTLRAFLNGKMDLVQAEAVADLIASGTKAAQETALNQVKGGFSHILSALREELIKFSALIELELDFSQEDVEFADRTRLRLLLNTIEVTVRELLHSFQLGNVIKNGVSVAIVGKPNVGKSTLLNALLQENRAIVSSIAGTTRDTIEEVLNIDGILFRLVDTAGIRKSTDEIEAIGIERTMEKMDKADIVLYMFDVHEEDLEALEKLEESLQMKAKSFMLIGNKADDKKAFEEAEKKFTSPNILLLSAKHQFQLDQLKQKMVEKVISGDINTENIIVTNARHFQSLQRVEASILSIQLGMDQHIPGDLLAIDIRQCLYNLGEITGEITNEDQLDFIFSKFCIGK